jgi:hypothetical protein
MGSALLFFFSVRARNAEYGMRPWEYRTAVLRTRITAAFL